MRLALVLGLLAACGDGLATPDAAAPGDTALGLVRARYEGNSPPGGKLVLFQNADSSIALATFTDDAGVANAYVAPGGFVTIAVETGNALRLYTWAGVQPGDDLVVDDGTALAGSAQINLGIAVPAAPDASAYVLSTACGAIDITGAQLAKRVIPLSDCRPHLQLLVLAYDATQHPTRYLFLPDADLTIPDVALAGPYHPIDVAHVAIANAPAEAARVSVRQRLLDGGIVLPFTEVTTDVSVAGAIAFDQWMYLPTGGTLETTVVRGPQRFVTWGPPGAVAIDATAAALRPSGTPAFAPDRNAVTWAETGPGRTADALLASLAWHDPPTDRDVAWRVLGPRDAAAELRLPALPAGFAPAPTGVVDASDLLAFAIDGGYPRLRTRLPITWQPVEPWPIDAPAGAASWQVVGRP